MRFCELSRPSRAFNGRRQRAASCYSLGERCSDTLKSCCIGSECDGKVSGLFGDRDLIFDCHFIAQVCVPPPTIDAAATTLSNAPSLSRRNEVRESFLFLSGKNCRSAPRQSCFNDTSCSPPLICNLLNVCDDRLIDGQCVNNADCKDVEKICSLGAGRGPFRCCIAPINSPPNQSPSQRFQVRCATADQQRQERCDDKVGGRCCERGGGRRVPVVGRVARRVGRRWRRRGRRRRRRCVDAPSGGHRAIEQRAGAVDDCRGG